MEQIDNKVTLEIICLLEEAKKKMEELRDTPGNMWNKRALSIAITELETSQLWLANARPD